jgi:NTP pyrophosphatase (non-canonical NTP hydrolase)
MTLQLLKEILLRFRDERDWVEISRRQKPRRSDFNRIRELLELFLWKDLAEIAKALKNDSASRTAIADELADVICFCVNFANALELDISEM